MSLLISISRRGLEIPPLFGVKELQNHWNGRNYPALPALLIRFNYTLFGVCFRPSTGGEQRVLLQSTTGGLLPTGPAQILFASVLLSEAQS